MTTSTGIGRGAKLGRTHRGAAFRAIYPRFLGPKRELNAWVDPRTGECFALIDGHWRRFQDRAGLEEHLRGFDLASPGRDA